ncbi:MAG: DEAD/DEAH box helicase family protein [Alphaproteobacteria bacterium]|nr:DEAD/DEAH box helicase family protein [Alphaproteobacteria bacterium]
MVDALALKDYQQGVLDTLDAYLAALHSFYSRAERNYLRDKEDGFEDTIAPEASSFCHDAWERVKRDKELPIYRDKKNNPIPNIWQDRLDGCGRKIPNICLKVPTGGGKTLLAACALQRINQDYFKINTGLVLWVVPTSTIYKQTMKALANKEHPYRKQLDFASGGRTKIMERHDPLDAQDVANNLCVMVLMLQSFNVGTKSKDARKLYSDAGRYMSFFPEDDDYTANNALLNAVPNLVEEDMLERNVIKGVNVKQSLGNVFRICRPVVIIDEEHRAKSPKAIENINQFNPKFILELSATPRNDSNKLVDVGGQDLKNEQMIKLPINVKSSTSADWRITLEQAHETLASIGHDAAKLQGEDGTYIRPIMVIIAEPKKKGEDYDQVQEIKKHLMDKCQAQEREIKIKLSENDEIKDDDLMDRMCPVRYIITKDALREGWDCPFAYVLTILAPKHSQTALTQYTGRVLRQPYARTTTIEALNQSYVFCSQQDVTQAVELIKKGLEAEGMGDIASEVVGGGNAGEADMRVKETITRNTDFEKKIFLPQLNAVDAAGELRPFDYYRDILGEINWQEYVCDKELTVADKSSVDLTGIAVDYQARLDGQHEFTLSGRNKSTVLHDGELNISLLTSQLTDKIPNPFEARRILQEALDALRKTHKEAAIASAGHDIVRQIKDHVFAWLLKQSEALFVQKLKEGKILLNLLAAPHQKLNWDMQDSRVVYRNPHETPAIDWDKNMFQPQFQSNYNGLEKDVAAYVNASEAVKWWHRLGVKGTEYAVQGWKKDKIYPDFLIMREDDRYVFVETKGNHLKNEDSEYKAKVFSYLTQFNQKPVGDFKLMAGGKEMSFHLVYQDVWKEDLVKVGM